MKMSKNSHFQRGAGSFKCGTCGRQTRHTGVQAMSAECCPDCWELGGLMNAHYDGCLTDGDGPTVLYHCQNIVNKDGKLDGDALELLKLTGQPVPQKSGAAA
jgi:hypothetical protein